jgi:arsenate reductase
MRYSAAKAAGLKTVLFICSGNSIRSQIAEGLVNHLFSEKWAAFSAGILPMPVPKDLVKVMREIGIDISKQREKHVDIFRDCEFDRVVVLCSDVSRICPILPDCKKQEHMLFSDPLSSTVSSGGICFGFTATFRQLREEMKRGLTAYMKDA